MCVFGIALALAGLLRPILYGGRHRVRSAARAARVVVAALFIVSGMWLMIAPRADQPLLDSVEYMAPELRRFYLNELELEVYGDAERHAERYRRQAERLNEKEVKSRWQGEGITDTDVRRIASFLQSYNEMRKGEEFVKREVRSRARERTRWVMGGILIVFGLLMAPWRPDRARARASGASNDC